MEALFYAEAAKYDVLPLDNSTLARFTAPRPNLTAGRTEFTYTGADQRHTEQRRAEHPQQVLHHHGRGHDPRGRRRRRDRHRRRTLRGLRAVPEQGRVRVGPGPRGLHVQPARPEADDVGRALPRAGQAHRSSSTTRSTGRVWARAARVSCRSTARKSPRTRWRTARRSCSPRTKTFDVGSDTRTGVALAEYRYDSPFPFTGTIDRLTFDLAPRS